MKYRVRYLATAGDDREAIKTYLAQFSPSAAKRLFDKIKHNIDLIKLNPYMYEVYSRRPIFRRMVVYDYLVFYAVNEKHHIIEVHRILHGKLDIESEIGEL